MTADRDRCGYPIVQSLGPETDLVVDERGAKLVVKKLNESCLLQGRLHPSILERLQRVRELPLHGVANFQGVQRDGEYSFLIWAFVEGRPLDEYVAGLSVVERSAIVREVKIVVDALHAAGLVHGAIHARNVIVDDRGRPHLTHISPLLFYDPAIDQTAVKRMIHELVNDNESELPMTKSTTPADRDFTRLRSIALAAVVAVLGGAIGFFIYRHQR